MRRAPVPRNGVSADDVRRVLRYDPQTGDFFWRVNRTNGVKAGDRAGCRRGEYWVISIFNVSYRAQRLAFLYMTGEFPSDYVDHINGKKLDNRWDNLRPATNAQNQHNRAGTGGACGIKNVTYVARRRKYQVSLKVFGREKFIGYYQDCELAELVATEARNKYHGPYANHL